jgi:hypothetical protein
MALARRFVWLLSAGVITANGYVVSAMSLAKRPLCCVSNAVLRNNTKSLKNKNL